MNKPFIIALLAISIILQNTCLMGAAGQSVLFRVLDKGCRMHCHMGCHAKDVSDEDGVKSTKKNIEETSKPAICYFQFNIEDAAAAIAVPITQQRYSGGEDRLKHAFLDPPIKPPGPAFSS